MAKTRDTVSGPAPRTRAKRFKLLPQPGLSSRFLATPPLLKNKSSLDNLNTNHPPQPHSRNQKAQNFRPFPTPINTSERDASYVRRYPSEPLSTKPISHGHPPLDEFMSIENLKTIGMSPSIAQPPFRALSIATPTGTGSTSRSLAASCVGYPSLARISTAIDAYFAQRANQSLAANRPLRRSRRRQPRWRRQTDSKLYPYSDSAYVHAPVSPRRPHAGPPSCASAAHTPTLNTC